MTTYYVEITDEDAPEKIAEDPDLASQQLASNLASNSITISTGGGIAFTTAYYDESDELQEGLFAVIDAESDPTTVAQAFSWEYAGASDISSTLLDNMQTLVTLGAGNADDTQTQLALISLMQYLNVPLNYGS